MRASELVIAVFLTWTTALGCILPLQPGMRSRILLANGLVALIYGFVWRFHERTWVVYARDWIAQAIAILAYKQMGWFAPAIHTNSFEQKWIVWDRMLLYAFDVRNAIELPGPFVPTLLELAYSLVYALPPFTMGLLYALGLRRRADLFLTIYLAGLFLSYGQFPFWPSEPPRSVFAGQDLPGVYTPVRDFNLWLVGTQGIHTSVFPSAHVSGVVAAAMAVNILLPRRRKVVAGYFVYAALVAIATVYGRYHYVVDAVGGIILGVVATPLGMWLWRTTESRAEADDKRVEPSVRLLKSAD